MEQEELEHKLRKLLNDFGETIIDGCGGDWDADEWRDKIVIPEFVSLIHHTNLEASLKARLVELDLLEQFINRHADKKAKSISITDLDSFKLYRLEDLETRLKAELAKEKK